MWLHIVKLPFSIQRRFKCQIDASINIALGIIYFYTSMAFFNIYFPILSFSKSKVYLKAIGKSAFLVVNVYCYNYFIINGYVKIKRFHLNSETHFLNISVNNHLNLIEIIKNKNVKYRFHKNKCLDILCCKFYILISVIKLLSEKCIILKM